MTSLSVIVPATNAPPTLARCREGIEQSTEPAEEVIVVESADGPGPAFARNEGARQASGDVLVFIDSDVVAHPDALQRIRGAFDSDPDLDALFGSYDDTPSEGDAVSGFRNLLHHHVHTSSPGPAVTFWAGLGAIRREVFEAAGGFDADRYSEPSIEDVELGMRISGEGGLIVLDPRIRGTHLKRWTLGSMVMTDFAKRGVPWVQLLAGRQGFAAAAAEEALADGEMRVLNLSWTHRLSAAASLTAIAALIIRRPRVAIAGFLIQVLLNSGFYRLLIERRGLGQAIAGVGLHAIHHLASAAAVPVGLAAARETSTQA